MLFVDYEHASGVHYLHADERGSIVAITDAVGNPTAINTYDEFGKPGASNSGRFQYTGQKWIGEVGLYDYKARMYAPGLGRFVQTDPVGYAAGANLYAYVGNDPVNGVDPSGLKSELCANTCTGSSIPGVEEPFLTVNGADVMEANMVMGNAAMSSYAGISDAAVSQMVNCSLTGSGCDAPLDGNPAPISHGSLLSCGPEDICVTASLRHDAGIVGDASELVSNTRDLWSAGLAGEQLAHDLVRKAGYTIVGVQVYVRTPLGLRITDILATNGHGLTGFEVKTSLMSRYNSFQQQKDSYISHFGGTIVGRNPLAGGLQYGDVISYPTLWVYILDLAS